MEREYIKNIKPSPLPNYTHHLKELDDEFWKKWVFYYLLNFYQNYNKIELIEKIESERRKPKSDIEDLIAVYIRNYFRKNRLIELQGFKVVGGINNDLDIKGLYDISFLHSYWNKDFHFECKNLDNSQDLVNKYVCYNKGNSIFDGGVLRYFNGKYAQSCNFGGMIGFVLEGDKVNIKNKIFNKLNNKFNISPEGDLISIDDNSIEDNEFTFNSIHKRNSDIFLIHHIFFDFT
ncbi:hypothetical protein SLW70_01515 [Flavobacterium sp. NG2]|uniref:hypothetical protein n=1 Tax=Flavobacterium sp. NG2 TaxID=3097547 RepID=UPI002A83213C|nr:hypothetical protein [Flavobacterium sp. NG2]WPR71833.1 hypothetical protein SLW70_01515 [Flavobacterium sp. NG2]